MQDRDYDRDRAGRTDYERGSSTHEGEYAPARRDQGAPGGWQDRGDHGRGVADQGDRGAWDDRAGQGSRPGWQGQGQARYGRQDVDRGATGQGHRQDWQGGPGDDEYGRGDGGQRYGQNWQGSAGASGSMRGTDDSTRRQPYGGQQQYGGTGSGGYGADAPVVAFSYTEYWLVPGPHSGKGPRGYRRSDERIGEEIGDRLTRHGQVDASEIEVQVANGEVTLAGTAEDRRQKRLAEDLAEDVPGVRDVHNQIKVRGGAGFGEGFIEKVKEALNPNAGTEDARTGSAGTATGMTATSTGATATGASGRRATGTGDIR